MRIGGLAVLIGAALCVLLLRAWSIQVLHGPQYKVLANQQSFRFVDLPGPRGSIVDAKGRPLAGTTGHIVVDADVGALGSLDTHGWQPTSAGSAALEKLSQLSGTPVATLLTRIRRSVTRSPFAPAIVLPHPEPSLATYLRERAAAYPGFKVTQQPARSYPQGALGSEFLGLLGDVSQKELASPLYKHARAGAVVGQSGVEATYDSLLNPGLPPARLRVDSMGRIAGPLQRTDVHSLPTLQLTIDMRLQRAAMKAVQDGIVRNNDGRLIARGDNGEEPVGDFLAKFVQENPEFLPARIAGGTGMTGTQKSAPQTGGGIDINDINPSMSKEDLERARQEILRIATQTLR